ncbi:MAG: glycerol-3-phosphate 1-O-acyltransferase PlsY [Phycisphaerae bacterium]|nr:glycerol-3-phosphate 1-O-acyltransferase PlsY [Phycisphaerae bacterium]
MIPAVLVIGAYLLGAIPFGLLIGLAHGVNVRTQGSRNIGATNVGRVVGRKWGYLCLAADILKGFAPTLCASLLLVENQADPRQQLIVLLVALAAVLGHVFSVYLGFRGGKGVATTIGVALGIWPVFTIAMIIALLAYALARFTTGMVSVGSLVLAFVFPAAFYGYTRVVKLSLADYWPLQTVAVALGLMIIVRHRDNIRRLLRDQEKSVKE